MPDGKGSNIHFIRKHTPRQQHIVRRHGYENGYVVPKGRFIEPRVEAEFAFVLKAPLKGRAHHCSNPKKGAAG
jgi:2-keto-4-pentenoate hydratase